MYTTLTFSYLLLPVILVFFKNKRKELVLILLAAYGIFAFSYLRLEIEDLPLSMKAAYALSFTTIEYLFFASFFYFSMSAKNAKRVILILSIAFIIFQTLFYFNVKDDQFRLDTIPIGVETILLFVYTFFFFYESLKSNTTNDNLFNSFAFWVAVGILLYLGASFFFFILANDMNQQEIDLYWPVTYVAEMIKNLVFCVAIFMYRPKSNDPKKNFRTSQDGIPHLI